LKLLNPHIVPVREVMNIKCGKETFLCVT